MEKPILNPRIPYTGPIYGGKFVPQSLVRIQGTVPSVAYRFNINLQCGMQTHPQSDIAIQISVRLLDNYAALNSLERGIWGEELRKPALPIKNGQSFEILIMCTLTQYMVTINGQHYCEFPQRLHHSRISHLSIVGDVSIARISYESGMGAPHGEASAPELTPTDDRTDDFELMDSPDVALLRRFSPTSHQREPPPPAYGMVVPDHSTKPMQANPYMGAPHSSSGAPPYPHYAHSPRPPPPGIYVPPSSATVPLNAPGSTVPQVKSTSARKCCYYCVAIMIGVILIIAIIFGKVERSHENNRQSYNDYN